MNILTDADGKILFCGEEPPATGIAFTGTLPEDFLNTMGLGKYKAVLVNGNLTIEAVPGWTPPVIQSPIP